MAIQTCLMFDGFKTNEAVGLFCVASRAFPPGMGPDQRKIGIVVIKAGDGPSIGCMTTRTILTQLPFVFVVVTGKTRLLQTEEGAIQVFTGFFQHLTLHHELRLVTVPTVGFCMGTLQDVAGEVVVETLHALGPMNQGKPFALMIGVAIPTCLITLVGMQP